MLNAYHVEMLVQTYMYIIIIYDCTVLCYEDSLSVTVYPYQTIYMYMHDLNKYSLLRYLFYPVPCQHKHQNITIAFKMSPYNNSDLHGQCDLDH